MELNLSCFEKYPMLQTKRLTLRQILVEDAESILAMRSNARVSKYIHRPPMKTIDEANALIEKVTDSYRRKESLSFAGILRDGKKIIGTCGFRTIDTMNWRGEIGGELSPEFWGKGIAQEAVNEVIRFGFEEINLHTIEAKVLPANRGAVLILERMGFVKEAHFREYFRIENGFHDMVVFTLFNPKH